VLISHTGAPDGLVDRRLRIDADGHVELEFTGTHAIR
jgi:hypothetical protein